MKIRATILTLLCLFTQALWAQPVTSAPPSVDDMVTGYGLSDDLIVNTWNGTGYKAKRINITKLFQARMPETVYAEDFGAIANGTNDATAAIQAAIDYVWTNNTGKLNRLNASNGCGVVRLAGEAYNIVGTITNKPGVTLLGNNHCDNYGWSRLMKTNDGTILCCPSFSKVEGVLFRGNKTSTNATGNTIGIQTIAFRDTGAAGAQIDDCYFIYCTEGLHLDTTWGDGINHCYFVYGGSGVVISNNAVNEIEFKRCTFLNCYSNAVFSSATNSYDIHFEKPDVEGCAAGFLVANIYKFTIKNAYIENNVGNAVTLTNCEGFTLEDDGFHWQPFKGRTNIVVQCCTNFMIAKNLFDNWGSTNIVIDNRSAGWVKHNTYGENVNYAEDYFIQNGVIYTPIVYNKTANTTGITNLTETGDCVLWGNVSVHNACFAQQFSGTYGLINSQGANWGQFVPLDTGNFITRNMNDGFPVVTIADKFTNSTSPAVVIRMPDNSTPYVMSHDGSLVVQPYYTPATSSSPGTNGASCHDATYDYFYAGGRWYRNTRSSTTW